MAGSGSADASHAGGPYAGICQLDVASLDSSGDLETWEEIYASLFSCTHGKVHDVYTAVFGVLLVLTLCGPIDDGARQTRTNRHAAHLGAIALCAVVISVARRTDRAGRHWAAWVWEWLLRSLLTSWQIFSARLAASIYSTDRTLPWCRKLVIADF